MTTNAVRAFGTQFQRENNVPAFVTIAEVSNITPPSLSAGSIDVTTHDSTDRFQEFIQGLRDAGEVSLELNFIPDNTGHLDLLRDYESDDTNRNYKIIFPDTAATAWTFSAHVTGFEVESTTEDQLTAAVTFKVSGKPTLAT